MAVINKDITYMALPLAIRRGNPFPIDEYAVWYDMGELTTYAQTNPVAYVGQIVTLVNESASTVEAYMIQNTAGNLMKLASTTASGDLTEDVLELQGQVTDILAAIGTKGGESSIAANNLWAAIEEIKAAYEAADTSIEGMFENYYDKTETDSKIATAISSTYKPAGSTTYVGLPAPSADEEGKVYNVSDAFTTDEDFVEGTGISYPAGTNVVCIDSDDAGTYKWDVLSGFVDLSAYETTASVDSKLANKVDKVEGSSLVQDTLITKLTNMAQINGVASGELAIDGESHELSIVAVDSSKVTGLDTALEGKVDVVAGSSLVQDTLISKLSALATINNVNQTDFSLSDGTLALNNIEMSKVNGLETALDGVITTVQVNGAPLLAADGTVNIGLAGAGTAGVVVGSADANKVSVGADGTMEVNSLNVDKLVQTGELILNGGDATVE